MIGQWRDTKPSRLGIVHVPRNILSRGALYNNLRAPLGDFVKWLAKIPRLQRYARVSRFGARRVANCGTSNVDLLSVLRLPVCLFLIPATDTRSAPSSRQSDTAKSQTDWSGRHRIK